MRKIEVMFKKSGVLVAISAFIQLAVWGCSHRRAPLAESNAKQENINLQVNSSPTPSVEPQREISFEQLLEQVGFLEKGSSERVLSAWKNVPDHKNFRVARADDFKIPRSVGGNEATVNAKTLTLQSYEWGEMSGNYGDNLAVILVDRTKPEPNRFGLALFIERKNKPYSFYWIFRDKDLSRVTVNRHSGNVYLEEFREDGARSGYCDIQWSRQQGKWACDL